MNRHFAIAASLAVLAACGQTPQPTAPTIPPTELAAVRTPPPQYPIDLACAGIGGTVTLTVTIGPESKPRNVALTHSSGQSALDASALKAVQDWDFKPATFNGQPLAKTIQVPVNFKPPVERPAECFKYDERK
ncbi:MAG: energy transducer TonB [Pseudoxanthomonas sp.]